MMSCGNSKQQLERAGVYALAICAAPYINTENNEIVYCNCPFSAHRDEAALGQFDYSTYLVIIENDLFLISDNCSKRGFLVILFYFPHLSFYQF